MTTESLAKIYNIPMTKLSYSDFAIQAGKLDARLILSFCQFAVSTSRVKLTQYSTEIVLIRWLSLWFKVTFMWSSHFARAFRELQCIVRVISAARFENTWFSHSANFENRMETGLNILFSQTGKVIMIELSLFSLPYFASAI